MRQRRRVARACALGTSPMPLRLPYSLHDAIAGAIAIASHPQQKRPKLTPGDHAALIILEEALRSRGQVTHRRPPMIHAAEHRHRDESEIVDSSLSTDAALCLLALVFAASSTACASRAGLAGSATRRCVPSPRSSPDIWGTSARQSRYPGSPQAHPMPGALAPLLAASVTARTPLSAWARCGARRSARSCSWQWLRCVQGSPSSNGATGRSNSTVTQPSPRPSPATSVRQTTVPVAPRNSVNEPATRTRSPTVSGRVVISASSSTQTRPGLACPFLFRRGGVREPSAALCRTALRSAVAEKSDDSVGLWRQLRWS